MPYRPSANNRKCTGANAGKWWHKATANAPFECFTEKAFVIAFSHVVLPGHWPGRPCVGKTEKEKNCRAIVSVAYNTTNYGPHPKGTQPCDAEPAGCPYDSLNVAPADLGKNTTNQASNPGWVSSRGRKTPTSTQPPPRTTVKTQVGWAPSRNPRTAGRRNSRRSRSYWTSNSASRATGSRSTDWRIASTATSCCGAGSRLVLVVGVEVLLWLTLACLWCGGYRQSGEGPHRRGTRGRGCRNFRNSCPGSQLTSARSSSRTAARTSTP